MSIPSLSGSVSCQTAPRRQRTCGTVGRHSQFVGARDGSRLEAVRGAAHLHGLFRSGGALDEGKVGGRACPKARLPRGNMDGHSSSPSARHTTVRFHVFQELSSQPARSPATTPWRCRSASHRSRSNGSWVCATRRIIGTSFRATAHTAFVLQPPLRASIAS